MSLFEQTTAPLTAELADADLADKMLHAAPFVERYEIAVLMRLASERLKELRALISSAGGGMKTTEESDADSQRAESCK